MKKLLLIMFTGFALMLVMAVSTGPVPAYAADPIASKDSGVNQHPFRNDTAVNVRNYSKVYDTMAWPRKTFYTSGFTNNTTSGKQAKVVRQVSYAKNGTWFDNWSTSKDGAALADDDTEYNRFYLKDAKKPITMHFRFK